MAGSIGPIPLPEAGQKRSGLFTFEADPELARYQWPYFSIVGAASGPTFLVTAGIHAAEYTGIEAAIRLGRTIDPADVRGTIIIVPLLNRPGFYERSIYVNPEDNDNMNRVFPGRPDGTWSERFAHHFLNDVIAGANYAIDLHAGDMIEDLVPFVGYRRDGPGGGRSDGAADARRVRRCLGHQDAAERRACRAALRRCRPARRLGDPGRVRPLRPAGRGGGPAPRRRRPQHPADARHPGGRAGRRRRHRAC